MSILLGRLTQFWPVFVLAGVAIVSFLKGQSSGSKRELAKQAVARQKAAEELHEMDREATEAERKAADLTDAEASKEGLSWRKS